MSTFLKNFHPMSRDVPQELIVPRTFFFPPPAGRAAKNAYFPKKYTIFRPFCSKNHNTGALRAKNRASSGKKSRFRAAVPAFCPVFSALRPEKTLPFPHQKSPAGRGRPSSHRPPSPAQKTCSVAPQTLLHSARHEELQGRNTVTGSWRCRAAASASIPAGKALPCACP